MKNALLFFLFALLPMVGNASATWVGPAVMTAAAYNNPANWSPSGVPTTSENITFTTAVTIASNVGIGSANTITISGTGSLTINAGVTVDNSDISINGPGGSFTNNGTFNGNNFTYGTTSGGVVTNNGTMSLNNLNVGNGTHTGTFTNNGSLAIAANLVVEEGTFDNNPTGSMTDNGIDVRSGGTLLNGGTITSTGTTSTAQVTVAGGGKFKNEVGSQLNIDISIGNVYALDVSDSFDNKGNIYIGNNPYNPNASGVVVRTTGIFSNTATMTFQIDPSKCVFTDNHTVGAGGSFFSNPVAIISGSNCGFTVALPIELSAFSGSCSGGRQVALNWEVNTGEKLQRYEVLRSSDGREFSLLSVVPAQENTKRYSVAVDQSSLAAYYQLGLVDLNGKSTYSQVLNISCRPEGADAGLLVYPNLLHGDGQVQVEYNSESSGMMQVNIVSSTGARVLDRSVNLTAGRNVLNLQLSGLAQGIYFVRVSLAGKPTQSRSIAIQ